MICIVDYGMGNLRNVLRACREIGAEAAVSSDSAILSRGDAMILPGVGAFGEAMRRIHALGLRSAILDHVRSGKPLLGICLGMQVLFHSSEESPGVEGLGLLSGGILRFGGGVKVPHIGWNDVTPRGSSLLFGDAHQDGVFYFDHSYYAERTPETTAVCTYGTEFSAAIHKENIFGVQFHPEKSQSAGLELLRRFGAPGLDRGSYSTHPLTPLSFT
jgi:glutamine amidotransferase